MNHAGSRRTRWFLSAALGAGTLVLVATGAGCAGGKAFQEARRAEEQGDPHRAYEYYCSAAAESPGSGAIAAGLSRTRAGASAYWESQALLEMDAGRYDEAWRMLMKSLEIQPNSLSTAGLIRQIQLQHSDQVALARLDWLRRGDSVLASAIGIARRGVGAPPERRPAEEVLIVQARLPGSPLDDSSEEKTTLPINGAAVFGTDAHSVGAAEPAAPQTLAAAPEIRVARTPSIRPETKTARGGPEAAHVERPLEIEVAASDYGADGPTEKNGVELSNRPESALDPVDGVPGARRVEKKPARPPLSGYKGDFLVVQTLSLKDRAYPKSAALTDDISVRLRDTDDDLEADFDLYAGRTRVKKIRELKIGRSQVFTGASGNLFRLTLLGIHHKSRTVRIGIKPA